MPIRMRAHRAAFGIGSGLVAGFLSRGLSAEAQQPPSLASLEQRISALEQQQRRRPVVVCGPSGVGKGTLLGRLMAECPDDYGFSVSHTTRQPRPGEQNGVHYHFVSKDEMEAMIAEGGFIEYARVHSNLYGTSIAAVRDVTQEGKTCLLDIDVQGAELVKKTDLCARFLFVAPPCFEDLEKRLRGRGTESEEKIQLRLKNARGELAYLEKPDFFDAIIVNDDLENAYARLKEVVLVPPPPAAPSA
jgi:guanylate kinase